MPVNPNEGGEAYKWSPKIREALFKEDYKGLKEGRSITLNDKDILISNKTYGAVKGLALTVWRILRCNPFAKGGYDPVP